MDMTNQDYGTGQPILSVLPSGEKYGVGLFGGRRYLYRGAGAVQPLSELGDGSGCSRRRRLHHPDPGGGAADRAWVV